MSPLPGCVDPASQPAGTRLGRLGRASLWLALLAAVIALTRWDIEVMRWRLMMLDPDPSGFLKQTLVGFRDFAQPVAITAVLVAVYLTDRRRIVVIGAFLVALGLGALACYGVKACLPRYRPYAVVKRAVSRPAAPVPSDELGAGWSVLVTQVREPADLLAGVKSADTWAPRSQRFRHPEPDSFPSGHTYAAFALAGVLAWFYPHLRWLFWALATGCAASRFIDMVHWPSDCVAGAAIGYAAAWIALRPYIWALPLRRAAQPEKR